MPIGDQHQGGVALALSVGFAALAGGLDELLDLVRRQVLTLAQVGIDRLSGIVRFWCVDATSRSFDLACILLPPVELIVLTMSFFRSIDPVKSAQYRVVIRPGFECLLR